MSKPFNQNIAEYQRLAEMESEEVAGYVLEHLHTITEGKSHRFHAGNLALEISRGYPVHEQEQISDAIRLGCQWLKNHDFIYERTDNGFFDFTKKGQGVTTAVELLDSLGATVGASRQGTDPGTLQNYTAQISTNVQDKRVVFVVHGRNIDARNALFRFLRSIGLWPLEWSQAVKETGKASPFIGEILDAAFSRAQAVVVLMTPDDVAQLQEPYRSPQDPPFESQLTGQARPNVLFEAGMAMGRGPDRTVIVELSDLRPFSDIAGRHTVRLSNESAARHELAQRLETAGCAINITGRDWHAEGDFNFKPVQPHPAAQDEVGASLAGTSWDFREVLSDGTLGRAVAYSFNFDGNGRYISPKEKGDISWQESEDAVAIVREDGGEFILTRMRRDHMVGYFYPPIRGGFQLRWAAFLRE